MCWSLIPRKLGPEILKSQIFIMSLLPLYCKILDDSVRPLLPASFMSQALTDAMLFNYSKIPLQYRQCGSHHFLMSEHFFTEQFHVFDSLQSNLTTAMPSIFLKRSNIKFYNSFHFLTNTKNFRQLMSNYYKKF